MLTALRTFYAVCATGPISIFGNSIYGLASVVATISSRWKELANPKESSGCKDCSLSPVQGDYQRFLVSGIGFSSFGVLLSGGLRTVNNPQIPHDSQLR